MTVKKLIIFAAAFSLLAILPCFASAQSLSLTSEKSEYIVGEEIPVALSLDTSGKLINVVDATVSFPDDFFEVKSIESDDSVLKLWPKRPEAENGAIYFTGGIPHGFNGPSGNIFNFVLKPKKTGEQIISLSNASLLLNDGLGTKVDKVALAPLKILIIGHKK